MNSSFSIFMQNNIQITHHYQMVEDIKLHYVTSGNKENPPVLLLPSWPQTWYAWRHIIKALSKYYYVIALDTRGIGYSSKPQTGYDTITIAKEVHKFMDLLGYDKYRVVGFDIGMWVGYSLGALFPHAVVRLALTEGSIPGIAVFQNIMMPKQVVRFRAHFLYNQLADLPEYLIIGKEEGWLRYIFDNMAYKIDRVAVYEYINFYKTPGVLRAGLQHYREIQETETANKELAKEKLKPPLLVVGGDKSNGDNMIRVLEPISENFKEGVVIKNCGHYVPEECYEEFTEILIPFLE